MKKIFTILVVLVMTATIFISGKILGAVSNAQEYSLAVTGSGWKKNANVYSYIDASGKKVKGWNRLNGMWYYFNSRGEMLKGKQLIANKTYLFNEDGSLNKILKNEDNKANIKANTENKKSPASRPIKKDPNLFYDKSGRLLGRGKRYISNASAYTGDTTTASGQRPRWGTFSAVVAQL